MGRKRRQFSNQFKFTVALEAVKGLKTVNQIAGDGVGKGLLSEVSGGSGVGAFSDSFPYDTYSYDRSGNILSRTGTDPDLVTYGYGNRAASGQIPAMSGGPHAVTYVDVGGTANDWRYDYDAQGNLDDKYEGSVHTHDYTFDVENRLASVRTNNQTTTFAYDADGQRILTSRPNGTVVYTPFLDYEREVTDGGAVTERTTYTIAGQMVAVRVKVSGGSNTLYYTYTDHLGSVVAMSDTAGGVINGSLARYDPFGNYRTWPGSNVNPLISDRGFTGHVHDNTGDYPTENVGLIYMNARYYLPEVGRFISADTIVPEAEEPQSYNRYAYAQNDPVNFTDPTGHCTNNYEAGSADMDTCVAGWNAVVNYLSSVTYGAGGNGQFPNKETTEWLMNADIATVEGLMRAYGIDYGYTWAPPQGYQASSWSGRRDLKSPEARAEVCDYWQSCYEPVVTGEEMKPDAIIIPGASGSIAGIWYGIAGVELVGNFRSEEASLYGYSGQGAGVAIGTDVGPYFGIVWNLEDNSNYAGEAYVLSVDFTPYIGGQAQFSWETGTVPFTGETWGISIGPSTGASAGVSLARANYQCLWNCD